VTLPRRIPKAPKRATRWRSQAHANFVRSHFCCVLGCDRRPIEFAHVRIGSGAGVGQKPDDWNAVSLCQHHHDEQHRIGETSFQHKHCLAFGELIAEFIKASPKRVEIEQVRREREQ
jgi:hypothetical protein